MREKQKAHHYTAVRYATQHNPGDDDGGRKRSENEDLVFHSTENVMYRVKELLLLRAVFVCVYWVAFSLLASMIERRAEATTTGLMFSRVFYGRASSMVRRLLRGTTQTPAIETSSRAACREWGEGKKGENVQQSPLDANKQSARLSGQMSLTSSCVHVPRPIWITNQPAYICHWARFTVSV